MNRINIKFKKKWIAISIAILGSIFLIYAMLPKFYFSQPSNKTHRKHLREKGRYYVPVKIICFSSADIPCFNVEVEGKLIPVKIDLGFSGDISLPNEILKDLQNKLFIRTSIFHNIRGKTYECNVYELPEIRIGEMLMYRPKVKEMNSEFEKDIVLMQKGEVPNESNLGVIGWELFYNFNVLLDCKQSTLAFCDGLETLKEQGYPVESFTEIPLLLNRNFVEFEARTEVGSIRCMIDSGSTLNFLNKDLEKKRNAHIILTPDNAKEWKKINPENKDLMVLDPNDIYETSCFKIGEKDFGAVKFQKIKSPLGIDAIIGMEFLEDKIVFIDFPERKIYFYERD